MSDDVNTKLLMNRSLTESDGQTKRVLTLKDLTLQVRVPRYTWVERDTTCDSTFMLDTVEEVGQSICHKMHWVSTETPIILFMDNAGGHGSNNAKQEYERIIFENFNILVEWQVPNSPDTNLLDLGMWSTHQSLVERMHRLKRMDADALSRTVFEAFDLIDPGKIEHIYSKWEYVLDLIVKGEGTNDLVKMNRGLSKSLDDLPDISRFYC
jgi:hypothetical protein